jgi:pimeloyl-ACP methyl ester carboxylesterase
MIFLSPNNIKFYYKEIGSGKEVILFIHGLGSQGKDWRKQVKFFSENYRCIVVDLRGHGQSDHIPPFDIPTFANDIIDLIEYLEISSLHMVGISLGGMVAFQIATEKPYFLKSLTIVNALPEFSFKNLKQKWMFFSRFFLIKCFGIKIFSKILAKKLFPQKNHQTLRTEFIKSFVQNNKKTYLTTLKSLWGWGVVDKLHFITCRILFIASQNDYSSLSEKRFFSKKINAEIVTIKHSHHAVTIENPTEFNRILQKFIHLS